MDRKQMLEKAFQRGQLLNLNQRFYHKWIEKFIVDETKGDIGKKGDITTRSVVRKNRKTVACIKAKQNGILAGAEETIHLLDRHHIKVISAKGDGTEIRKGEIVMKLYGRVHNLLRMERSALDVLSRMSGIATLTNELVKKSKVRVAPTRKTQWRYLDKKAVYLGGGLTHRLALWDAVLIKDNHLRAIKKEGFNDYISEALRRAFSKGIKTKFIEIEVQSKEEALKAAEIMNQMKNEIPLLIMLDNFKPFEIKKTIDEIKRLGFYDNILFEASGGITPENITEYAKTGIDVVSLGYLTHSVKALDMAMII